MKNKPKLAALMTSDPQTVSLGQPLSEVYTLLQNRSFHHVPIVEGNVPVGMISATDILKLVYDIDGSDDRMLRTFLDYQFTLEDAMTTELITVQLGDDLRTVVDHMASGLIHSVMVLNDDGELAGIITSTDLIWQLGQLL